LTTAAAYVASIIGAYNTRGDSDALLSITVTAAISDVYYVAMGICINASTTLHCYNAIALHDCDISLPTHV